MGNNKFKSLIKVIIGLGCALALILFGAIAVPWLKNQISTWGNAEIVAAITLCGVVVALSVPFIQRLIVELDKPTVYQIDIHVDTSLKDNVVLFSASIQNVGDKTITLTTANLYFDEGVESPMTDDLYKTEEGSTATYFDFPFILEHKQNSQDGRPDCVICHKCFRGRDESYPKEVLTGVHADGKLLHTHKLLDHLSEKSIKYICPREKFTEDILVRFPKAGAYRVTLFVGMAGKADCMCATKQFYIARDYNSNGGTSPNRSKKNLNGSSAQSNNTKNGRQKTTNDV